MGPFWQGWFIALGFIGPIAYKIGHHYGTKESRAQWEKHS